jgi:hypothetical protein
MGFPYRTLKHSATVNRLSNRSGLLLVGAIHINGRTFLDEAQLAVGAGAIHSEKVELIRIPGDSTSLPREAPQRRWRTNLCWAIPGWQRRGSRCWSRCRVRRGHSCLLPATAGLVGKKPAPEYGSLRPRRTAALLVKEDQEDSLILREDPPEYGRKKD